MKVPEYVRTLDDGAVDYDHYRALSRAMRTAEQGRVLRTVSRWLAARWRRLANGAARTMSRPGIGGASRPISPSPRR